MFSQHFKGQTAVADWNPNVGTRQHAVVVWVAPDGRQLHLSGSPDEGREGVYLVDGFDGAGHVEASADFVSGARQVGETVTGFTLDHGEVDLPLHIVGTNTGDMQSIREHVKGLFRRDAPGWLAVYTPITGWRWMRCRMLSMKPGLDTSPYAVGGLRLDVVLIADDPRSESLPYSSQWRNVGNPGQGQLWLSGGDEWVSWPSFVVHGPGAVSLTVAGSTIRLPRLAVGERCLLQTDPAKAVLRSVDAAGRSTNRWPDVDGYLASPLPVNEMSRVVIRVDGGSDATAVMGHARVYAEGLL